ncbi:unnamed protein product [Amoebophrya sp. A120]|nr:unnamed protein product [Amoebophrya sp. A120]|eukprot:GSA120T00012687001.1
MGAIRGPRGILRPQTAIGTVNKRRKQPPNKASVEQLRGPDEFDLLHIRGRNVNSTVQKKPEEEKVAKQARPIEDRPFGAIENDSYWWTRIRPQSAHEKANHRQEIIDFVPNGCGGFRPIRGSSLPPQRPQSAYAGSVARAARVNIVDEINDDAMSCSASSSSSSSGAPLRLPLPGAHEKPGTRSTLGGEPAPTAEDRSSFRPVYYPEDGATEIPITGQPEAPDSPEPPGAITGPPAKKLRPTSAPATRSIAWHKNHLLDQKEIESNVPTSQRSPMSSTWTAKDNERQKRVKFISVSPTSATSLPPGMVKGDPNEHEVNAELYPYYVDHPKVPNIRQRTSGNYETDYLKQPNSTFARPVRVAIQGRHKDLAGIQDRREVRARREQARLAELHKKIEQERLDLFKGPPPIPEGWGNRPGLQPTDVESDTESYISTGNITYTEDCPPLYDKYRFYSNHIMRDLACGRPSQDGVRTLDKKFDLDYYQSKAGEKDISPGAAARDGTVGHETDYRRNMRFFWDTRSDYTDMDISKRKKKIDIQKREKFDHSVLKANYPRCYSQMEQDPLPSVAPKVFPKRHVPFTALFKNRVHIRRPPYG